MDMEQALLRRIVDDSAAGAMLSDRVYWEERPQSDGYPAVTLQTISAPRDQHMKGFQALQRARVQADVWALSYGDKKAVTEALIAAVVPRTEVHGVKFRRAMIAFDGDRPAGGEGEPFIHRRQIDFFLWFSQAT